MNRKLEINSICQNKPAHGQAHGSRPQRLPCAGDVTDGKLVITALRKKYKDRLYSSANITTEPVAG
ncbi:MAG: hypothetical protein COB54_07205 [Alphaproteobacteria bacterium]|nr:MAG: hypothetical protein COB54_07205 [Alphaproteobacteria bacterium]